MQKTIHILWRFFGLIFFLLFVNSLPLFSFAGEYWELGATTSLDFTISNSNDKSERMLDLEYIEGFNNRPLLQLDLKLFHGPWEFQTEGVILSLRPPIVFDEKTLFSPMVKLAYIEYEDEFAYVSIGRRKQSIGISDYNLFVNRDTPFFDGLNISVGKATGFRFDSLVSVSNLSRLDSINAYASSNAIVEQTYSSPLEYEYDSVNEKYVIIDSYKGDYGKYFIYHALSYVGKTWYAMIGESAIYANPKSFGDLSIFPNIHNENSERANVGMEFQFAKMFNKSTLFYATFAIDDLPVLSDHTTAYMLMKNPSALAAGLGFKWHAISGDSFQYPTLDPDKGMHRNTRFGEMQTGGLTLFLDYVGTTRWMYNRTNQHDSSEAYFNGFQSFYNYFLNPQFVSQHDHFSVPFGLKYGGDSQIFVLRSTYETEKLKISGVVELLLQGIDGRTRNADINYWGEADLSMADPDDPNYSTKWITSGDIQPKLTVLTKVETGLKKWLSVYAGSATVFSTYLPFAMSLNFGVTVSL